MFNCALERNNFDPPVFARWVSKSKELSHIFLQPYVPRHDICHMHHMQRMCKIISPWVKFYILKVLFE